MSTAQKSEVDTANTVVSISLVCHEIGMSIPDLTVLSGKSFKTWCPFGFYHVDSGYEKAFRIYPSSNSAWCFAESEYFSPVRLYSQAKGIEYRDAATELLKLVNYRPPLDTEWESLVEAAIPLNKGTLVDALQIFCSRIEPKWSYRLLFDSAVQLSFDRCVKSLDQINSDVEAQRWLGFAKDFMQQELRPTDGT